MRRLVFVVSVIASMTAIHATAFAADSETLPGGPASGPAVARQCLKDLRAFDRRLAEVGFGTLPAGGVAPRSDYYVWGVQGTPREKLQAWWNAAYLYAMDGDERSCQMVLASMQKVFRGHQNLVGNESDDVKAKDAWRRAHLARAKPVAAMDHLMRAKILIGAEIRNLKDQMLGRIEDIVLNPGERNIRYVIVSRGGFLGFGEKWVAVRWNDLRGTEDHELYVLNVPPKALDNAPLIDRDTFAKTADPAWQKSLDQYWNRVLK